MKPLTIDRIAFSTYAGGVNAICLYDKDHNEYRISPATLSSMLVGKTVQIETERPRKYEYIKKMSKLEIEL